MTDQRPIPGPSGKRQRCVVHIGLNKTGSTTIQAWLQINQDALRNQGIWHDNLGPHSGPHLSTAVGWTIFAHSQRPNYVPGGWQAQSYRIRSRADLQERLDQFLTRVEATFPPPEDGTYVTSSEHIGAGLKNVPEMEKLHNWFAARFNEVRYVVYIREQTDWVASAYVQAVRSGTTESLDAYIENFGFNDYHALIEKWRGIAGDENVDVRIFDRAAFAGGDLIDDFADAIGVDASRTARPPKLNDSMPLYQLHLLLWGSRLFGKLVNRLGLLPAQRRFYSRNMPFLFGSKRLRLSPEQAARVRAMNADSNEALRALVFPAADSLFPGASASQSPRSAQGAAAAIPQVTGQ
ncbi:hypothetical protein [Nioella sediminis]|jgi:hypothetical protein|uniref:hypothetical protein n=1 Tax=Nioella sediminis TaxID=1912092 RepID=UPI0008FD16F4|nr:hypothetical protein [Nioella sediminis]TBX21028.1 hypothetical protein TK43_13590 [Roseovarius sp. JS7-11]